jgi:hypothetical protein
MPAALQTFWSSSPNAGAMCTTPVPSSVVTKSAPSTWNAFGPACSTRKSNSGVYRRPTRSRPEHRADLSKPSRSFAYAGTRAAPEQYRCPSVSRTAYSMSGPTASARLDGSVHGVVVQTATFSPVSSWNHTVSAGSVRSR